MGSLKPYCVNTIIGGANKESLASAVANGRTLHSFRAMQITMINLHWRFSPALLQWDRAYRDRLQVLIVHIEHEGSQDVYNNGETFFPGALCFLFT